MKDVFWQQIISFLGANSHYFMDAMDIIRAILSIEIGRFLMNSIQPIWSKAKKALKFVWRHCFTLYILTVIVRALFAGYTSLINSCMLLGIAAFFDWIKMRGKNTISHDHSSDEALHIRQRNNPSIIGTPAHHISTMGSGIRYD
jgi:hypothetical protein